MLYICILLCFKSTKLLILSQNKDEGTSFQHIHFPDHNFAGGYITIPCHREKHQASLEGTAKVGSVRKSTVSQKYSKNFCLQTDCCQLKPVSHLFWSCPGESCNNNSDLHFTRTQCSKHDNSKDHWSSLIKFKYCLFSGTVTQPNTSKVIKTGELQDSCHVPPCTTENNWSFMLLTLPHKY